MTATAVQNLGQADIKDIGAITPGGSFTTTNGFFTSRICGVGADFVSVGVVSPVAIYEDGAYDETFTCQAHSIGGYCILISLANIFRPRPAPRGS